MEEKPKRNKRVTVVVSLTAGILLAAILIAIVMAYRIQNAVPEGCFDYTVQKQQYYVEYSEQYDYLDVLTIEYPVLEESEETQGQLEHLQQINDAFYASRRRARRRLR